MLPNSFILVLRSVDDINGFSTDFTYHFKPPLKLDGQWQVALTDYISPYSKEFIFNSKITVECARQDGKEPQADDKYAKTLSLNLSFHNDIDGHDLAEYFINMINIREMFNWSSDKQELLEYKPLVANGVKYILRISNRSILPRLGFNPDDWDSINTSNKPEEKLTSLHPPKAWYNDRTICVKTNILSKKHNTLGVFLPTEILSMKYYGIVVKVPTPIYLDVAVNEIPRINIKLYGVDGDRVYSAQGHTTAVLHFRKV